MNRNTKTINSLVGLLCCLLAYACENHVVEANLTSVVTECDDTVSFARAIQPIIVQNCIRCHGGNQAPNLSNYQGIKENSTRILAEVTSRRMPIGGTLTKEEIALVDCWITNGALNN